MYEIYSDKEKFESIESESVLSSINEGTVKSPYKIVNINCRIPDVITAEKLELIHEEVGEELQEAELKATPADTAVASQKHDEPVVQNDTVLNEPEVEVATPPPAGEGAVESNSN